MCSSISKRILQWNTDPQAPAEHGNIDCIHLGASCGYRVMKQREAESSSGPPLLSTDTAAHAELRMRVPHNCPHYLIHFGSTMRAGCSIPSHDCLFNIHYNRELRGIVVKAMWSPAEPDGQYSHCLPTEQLMFGYMDNQSSGKAQMTVEQLTHICLTIRKCGRSPCF